MAKKNSSMKSDFPIIKQTHQKQTTQTSVSDVKPEISSNEN
jgi:hypothetical protein